MNNPTQSEAELRVVPASVPAPQGASQPGDTPQEHKGPHAGHGPADYYPLFDYLRIALAVGVFVAHADRTGQLPKLLGNMCVQVFFALSGFLIGGILVRSSIKDLPRFYFNRSTRIWVPYTIAIAILALFCVVKGQKIDLKLLEFFFYKVTFVYNTFGIEQLDTNIDRMPLQGTGNHFWSICVEEQFYLVAPLVLVLLPRGRVVVLVLVWLANFLYPHFFAGISLGVLLALSQKRYGDWFLRWSAQAVLLAVLGSCIFLKKADLITYEAGVPIGSVCTVALLAWRGKQSWLGQLLGGVSYPFYLNHWVGLVLRNRAEISLGLPQLVGTLMALTIAFVFNTLHYLYIDRLILAYRSRWYSQRVGLTCCAFGISLTVVGLLGGLALHLWPPP